MKSRGFKDGTRVEQRKIEIEAEANDTKQGMKRGKPFTSRL